MILPPQDWIQRQDAKERALVEAKLDYMGGSVTTIRTPPPRNEESCTGNRPLL